MSPTADTTYRFLVVGNYGIVTCPVHVPAPFQPSFRTIFNDFSHIVGRWVDEARKPFSDTDKWENVYKPLLVVIAIVTLLVSVVFVLVVWIVRQRRQLKKLQEKYLLTGLAHELGAAPSPQAVAPPPPKQDPAEALRRKVAASLEETPSGDNQKQGKVTSSNTFDI